MSPYGFLTGPWLILYLEKQLLGWEILLNGAMEAKVTVCLFVKLYSFKWNTVATH